MICVYTIRHLATGCFYIGSTGNFAKRQYTHHWYLTRGEHQNPRLQELFNQCQMLAWEFQQCSDRETAYQLEVELIKQHWDNPLLCNTSPGRGAYCTGGMPIDVRQRISQSQTGKSHSDETRELMSQQRLGKQKTTEWANKIADAQRLKIQVGGVVYNGTVAAGKAFGVSPTTVVNRARSTNPKFNELTN